MTHTARGSLTVYCGPMFSGKTTSLIQHIHDVAPHRQSIVLKPAFDTRYAEYNIITHDGKSIIGDNNQTLCPVLPVNATPNIPANIHTIFIDEIQFMENPHYMANLPQDIDTWLQQGKDIVAAGLDMDYLGVPFHVTAQLLAMADKVHKITARCNICHGPATRTIRTVDADERMVLGNDDIYEARCLDHPSA